MSVNTKLIARIDNTALILVVGDQLNLRFEIALGISGAHRSLSLSANKNSPLLDNVQISLELQYARGFWYHWT